MAKYGMLFPVAPRVEATFTQEQIELAAKIAFYQHPPNECTVTTAPDELLLDWSEDLLYAEGQKVIRVTGQVSPGNGHHT